MPSQSMLLSQPRHAAETHQAPTNGIDDLIVATCRTKDLSLGDSQAGLLKGADVAEGGSH